MKVEKLQTTITLPENVSARLEVKEGSKILTIEGPKGSVSREFTHPLVNIVIDGNKITLEVENATKRHKTVLNTYQAHIKNMIKGVTEGFVYKLKICYSHFPMTVSIQKGELVVKNFYGEKYPRTLALPQDVDVKVNGDIIEVSGIDIEKVGNCATAIEQLTRITNRDRRIFQDGIFIIEKNGKSLI
ncbi:MAG: large subunit ribosomal protein [Candidatus Woesearchaeota archaeon]|nr:large subunit ribosomal protein [Candidatus Woesearchaeota archaeon]MDN5327992.1 large subunit ribosomal protein [Candidatus Woesearchaeota archaeon]